MPKFIKISGWHEFHQHENNQYPNDFEIARTTHLDVHRFNEICDGPSLPKRDAAGKIVRDANRKAVLLPGTTLKILGEDKDFAKWFVFGTATEWVARIEAAILADRRAALPAPAPDPLKITDRGAWQPGENYVRLDLVGLPTDVSRKFLCIQNNRSTSDGVLTNAEFWVRFT